MFPGGTPTRRAFSIAARARSRRSSRQYSRALARCRRTWLSGVRSRKFMNHHSVKPDRTPTIMKRFVGDHTSFYVSNQPYVNFPQVYDELHAGSVTKEELAALMKYVGPSS